jgi:hypothetical protein
MQGERTGDVTLHLIFLFLRGLCNLGGERSWRKVRDGEDTITSTRDGRAPRNLFEQPPQILKHVVFFVRARAISDEELLAQVQRFPFTAAVPSLSPIEARNFSLYPSFSFAFRALSIDLTSN